MWELKDNATAVLTSTAFSIEVSPSQPERGIALRIGSTSSPAIHGFRISSAAADNNTWKLHETFVRGSDLVASYEPWPGDAVEPHFYWRYRESHQGKIVGLELIASVHTSLLDSRPALQVSGDLPNTGIENSDLPPGLFRMGTGKSGPQILLWVHPADFSAMKTTDKTWSTTLFEESSLEKGVIRRARLGFWLIPEGMSVREQVALFEEITHEAPPLTT